MCGIIGCVTEEDPLPILMNGLSNLDYRGYDSAGIALVGSSIDIRKRSGKLEKLQALLSEDTPSGRIGIGHTRWSTHGPPTDENAHPHMDCSGRIAVVHNGIIENYQTLRDELTDSGHTFSSETDTEVLPHLIEDRLSAGEPPPEAFARSLERLTGSYAVAAVFADENRIFGARSDSPLVLGLDDERVFLASDVPAFLEYTRRVGYLSDDQIVELTIDGWRVTDLEGRQEEIPIETVDWEPEQTGKGGYKHYMLKEIFEQPRSLRDGIRGRVDELQRSIVLEDVPDFGSIDSIQLIACGTSYHAAMYGASLFRRQGIPTAAYLASEYATDVPPFIGKTLLICVTQSGETADTLSAMREAKTMSGDVQSVAVTNVVGSTAARESDHTIYIRSGPEIGVAATKTFASQLVTLNLLVEAQAQQLPAISRKEGLIGALRDLPDAVQSILDDTHAETIANNHLESEAFFFIGRGIQSPVAMEGALKMKEITYTHAEGFPAGELKHGPLALVTERTPVFAIVTGTDEIARKTVGNVKEVEARGAPVIAVTDGQIEVERYADDVLTVPVIHPRLSPILTNVQLQLVAYYVADRLGRSIDKPRNLAKSVTVE